MILELLYNSTPWWWVKKRIRMKKKFFDYLQLVKYNVNSECQQRATFKPIWSWSRDLRVPVHEITFARRWRRKCTMVVLQSTMTTTGTRNVTKNRNVVWITATCSELRVEILKIKRRKMEKVWNWVCHLWLIKNSASSRYETKFEIKISAHYAFVLLISHCALCYSRFIHWPAI